MDFGASYIHPVEYAQICHGRHSVISSCCTAVVYIRAAQFRYNNNCIAFLLDQRSRGRDKPLGIVVTDILRLPGVCQISMVTSSLSGSTGVNGPYVPLRMEAIKSTALLRSYNTNPIVLALTLYGVSDCVWLGCKLHPGCQGALGRGRG